MDLFKGSFSSSQPFSKQTVSVPLPEEVLFGQRAQFVLPRMGDMISNITLSFKLPYLTRAPKKFESRLVGKVPIHVWRPNVEGDYDKDYIIHDGDTISDIGIYENDIFVNKYADVSDGDVWRVGPTDYTVASGQFDAGVPNNSDKLGYSDSISNAILEEASLLIGGQTIQTINGELLEIMNDLTMPFSMDDTLQKTQGRTYTAKGMTPAASNPHEFPNAPDLEPFPRRFYVPIRFFFYNKPEASIPHGLLTSHEVEVVFKLRSLKYASSINSDLVKPTELQLFVDYVTLGEEERAKMGTDQLEYVIPQYQMNAFELKNTTDEQTARLTFKHPVKELIFVIQDMDKVDDNAGVDPPKLFEYEDILDSLSIRLNDWEKLPHEVGSGQYLHSIVPMDHHSASPRRNIYVYSFTIRPEEDDASGSINFSRVLNPSISVRLKETTGQSNLFMRVYAVSLNVLVIGRGLGSLYFS